MVYVEYIVMLYASEMPTVLDSWLTETRPSLFYFDHAVMRQMLIFIDFITQSSYTGLPYSLQFSAELQMKQLL